MTTDKYTLTDDTITIGSITLYRIRALRAFGTVAAGDLGGYVASTDNLSQDGNAWVTDNARVADRAEVTDNALVAGHAWVTGNARVTRDTVCVDDLLWPVTITDNHMQIGCELHTFAAWERFSDREIAAMDGRDAPKFWYEHKASLFGILSATGRYACEN